MKIFAFTFLLTGIFINSAIEHNQMKKKDANIDKIYFFGFVRLCFIASLGTFLLLFDETLSN